MPALRFLNVDLDLFHNRRFDGVVRNLTGPNGRAGKMFILHEDVTAFFPIGAKARGAAKGHALRMETIRTHKSASAAIRAIAAAVRELPPRARAEWKSIRFKQLSMGYELVGAMGPSCGVELDADVVEMCAAIGCGVEVVVYSGTKVR